MAIGTDDTIWKFGTQDKISAASTSAVTDTSFSVAADVDSTWTNDDDATHADFVLEWQYASGTLDAGGGVNLYARLLNIQSTNDEAVPDASNRKHYLGTFKIDEGLGTATNEYIALLDAELPAVATSQGIEFYIENKTGVTISAGWDMWATPKSLGPHA